MAKGKQPTVTLIDPSVLTDAEKATLRAEAKKRVLEQQRQATMDAFLAEEIDRQRKALQPEQELKYISLDMAGHADRIMLDGVVYFHGQTYEVPKCVYDVLAETVQRGWQHEEHTKGAHSDHYRKPRTQHLTPGMANMAASQIMGVR